MADDSGNEDQWLYGDANPEPPDDLGDENTLLDDAPINMPKEDSSQDVAMDAKETEPVPEDLNESLPPGVTAETNGSNENDDDNEDKDSEDDDSDDDINVVIGDIKTSPTYPSLNIKRGNLIQTSSMGDKSKQQSGKFCIDEFESIGSINGMPAQEFNLDSLEDKPWRKPGADITDYFNYGFNEDTWRAYCERQKRMRVHESGAGLLPMNPGALIRSATSITNDNSKYSGNYAGPRKAGPPPGRRMMGSIDVIGGNSGLASRRVIETVKTVTPKENVIQVMTADRREYSRKPPASFPDVSVPPPGGTVPFEPPVPSFTAPYSNEFYNAEPDPYYQSYEPTQEQQWGAEPAWAPGDIKELTPGPTAISTIAPITTSVLPPSVDIGPPGLRPVTGPSPTMVPPPLLSGPPAGSDSPMLDTHSQDSFKTRESREDSPQRDRDSRSRSVKIERHRERSVRRERSRSHSRRHKSRSRSPNHRSQHKKKKSKRHEKSDSE